MSLNMYKRGPFFRSVRFIAFCLAIITNLWFLLVMLRLVEGVFNQKIAARDPDLKEKERLELLSRLFWENVSYSVLFVSSFLQNIISWFASITLSHHILSWSAFLSFITCAGCMYILWNLDARSTLQSHLSCTSQVGICLFAGQAVTHILLAKFTESVVYTFDFQP
jgi:hypothetical protein